MTLGGVFSPSGNPVSRRIEGTVMEDQRNTSPSGPSTSGISVLVVEDSPSVISLVEVRLVARGHRSIKASPRTIVFTLDGASDGGADADGNPGDPVTAIRTACDLVETGVVLVAVSASEIDPLLQSLPEATVIGCRLTSSKVAEIVESELDRRRAA